MPATALPGGWHVSRIAASQDEMRTVCSPGCKQLFSYNVITDRDVLDSEAR
jgi:hypothetical protein